MPSLRTRLDRFSAFAQSRRG
ncbi:MAG: hypothetical protein RL461_790, partial [Planctomycetota bacterium]